MVTLSKLCDVIHETRLLVIKATGKNTQKCLMSIIQLLHYERMFHHLQSVREELGCARARIRELEAQNRALSSLLVRQLRPQPRPSPATPHTPITPHTPRDLQGMLFIIQ